MILPSLLNKNMIYCDILDYCCGKTGAVVYQPSRLLKAQYQAIPDFLKKEYFYHTRTVFHMHDLKFSITRYP